MGSSIVPPPLDGTCLVVLVSSSSLDMGGADASDAERWTEAYFEVFRPVRVMQFWLFCACIAVSVSAKIISSHCSQAVSRAVISPVRSTMLNIGDCG